MSEHAPYALFLAVLLILPISALLARRLPLGATAKMVLAWIAIFAALTALVAMWQGAMGAGSILATIYR